ncbi:MAG: hypothetical protein JRJ51_19320 [Deltaproteobacteria bacterium]|nr:hypothetical protein [Deltaproteobacteria bacterium]
MYRVKPIPFFFLIPLLVIFFCATAKPIAWSGDFKVENSLPPDELADYNDSFDSFREDLWDKAAWVPLEKQKANLKTAEISIEDGQLKMQTKTGAFSKIFVGSKFLLKGDFDIQVDCQVDFLEDISEMDQITGFFILKKGKDFKDIKIFQIRAVKTSARWEQDGIIQTATLKGGKWRSRARHNTENFHGTFRVTRKGKKCTTFYKKEGRVEWKEMVTESFTDEEVMAGFFATNFRSQATRIKAIRPFTARFDNFRINAVQGIIEEDI